MVAGHYVTLSTVATGAARMLSLNTPFAAWTAVIVSGVLEVVFAIAMKYSEGFTRLWPSVLSIGTGILSVWLIGLSMKLLPVGTAYAVWSGIGAVGATAIGILWLQEPANAMRLLCVGAIIFGIVGLQLQEAA
jgi:quaternary ammonium compound-resistance protein SugE